MSVVAVIKRNSKIIICADSQITKGDERIIITERRNLKLTTLQNGLVIGSCGDLDVTRLIKANHEIFKVDSELTKEHIVLNIVPQLINILKQSKLLTSAESGYIKMDASILLAYKNKVFIVFYDFGVFEINNYAAIGSGGSFCLPFLSSKFSGDIYEHLVDMLQKCSMKNTTVSGPFVFLDLQNPNKIRIEKKEGWC